MTKESNITVEKCFYLLKEAENEAADLYAEISLDAVLKFPELSGLFERLAMEERTHVKKIEMYMEFQAEISDAFIASPEAESVIQDFLNHVKMIKKEILNRFDLLSQDDILRTALELENHMAENHEQWLHKVNNPKIRSLVARLNEGDNSHIEQIRQFLSGPA